MNSCNNSKLIKRLQANKPKIIEIDFPPNHIHSLEYDSVEDDGATKKNKFLYLSDASSINVFNEHFELMKTIMSIQGIAIEPSCLTSNQLDSLFISDHNDFIILCDLKFNLLTKVGVHGDCIGQFDHISNLLYINQRLYVCDTYNQRVVCLDSSSLSFLFSIQFDYEPIQIEILNNIACVMGNLNLYFYELNNSFNLIRKIGCNDCSIGLFSSHLIFALSYVDNKFIVYSLLTLEQSVELTDSLNELTIDYDDSRCVAYFDKKLVISTSSGKIFVF